jgi:hypothetical protein
MLKNHIGDADDRIQQLQQQLQTQEGAVILTEEEKASPDPVLSNFFVFPCSGEGGKEGGEEDV